MVIYEWKNGRREFAKGAMLAGMLVAIAFAAWRIQTHRHAGR